MVRNGGQAELGMVSLFGQAAYQNAPGLAEKVVSPIATALTGMVRAMLLAARERGEIRGEVGPGSSHPTYQHRQMIALGDALLFPNLNGYYQLYDQEMSRDRILNSFFDFLENGFFIEGNNENYFICTQIATGIVAQPSINLDLLLFPALMVLMYSSAFGKSSSMASYLTVLVINQDEGQLGSGFLDAMRKAEFDGKAAFTIMEGFTPKQAKVMLDEGKAAMLVTLPSDFSEAIQKYLPESVQIEMLGDPLNDTYAFTQSFLRGLLQIYSDQFTGWQQELPIKIEFLPNTGTMNDFQAGMPGIVVFGVLFGVITNAPFLTHERSEATIMRIKLSKTKAAQFLVGVALAGLILSLVQMLITFGVAYLVGFKPVGSLSLAISIGVMAGLGATGAGSLSQPLLQKTKVRLPVTVRQSWFL